MVFNFHLFISAGLLETIIDPTEEEEVKLSNIFLVSDGKVVSIIVDNRGDDGSRVKILPI